MIRKVSHVCKLPLTLGWSFCHLRDFITLIAGNTIVLDLTALCQGSSAHGHKFYCLRAI